MISVERDRQVRRLDARVSVLIDRERVVGSKVVVNEHVKPVIDPI